MELYTWGDGLIAEFGNDAYDFIKDLEPACVGVFLEKWEKLRLGKNFLGNLFNECRDNNSHTNALRELCEILRKTADHPNRLMEMFCCYRHFGHPKVNKIEGIKALRDNSRLELDLDEEILVKVSDAFNRTFILGFIRKHRRWPKVKIRDESKSHDLQTLLVDKPLGFSEYDLNITLSDWDNLIFDQEFQFDDFLDFTSLLSDTAISPYLVNWTTVFNKDLLKYTTPQI